MVVAGGAGHLLGQAGLAHAGLAEEERQVRAAGADGGGERVAEEPHLGVAADEGDAGAGPLPGLDQRLDGGPRLDGLVPPPDLDRPEVLVAEHRGGAGVGVGADDHLAGLGRRLEPGGGVHHVAHGRVVAAGPEGADEHLAGVDPDAHAHRGADAGGLALDRALHLEGGPHGPLGVVLVGQRCAEQRHHGVADDLVDPATVGGDVVGQQVEASVDEVLDLLGIGRLGQRGEADQVAEDHGDDPALVRCRVQGVSARGTEPGALGHRRRARRARHGRTLRRSAARPDPRSARRAGARSRRHRVEPWRRP